MSYRKPCHDALCYELAAKGGAYCEKHKPTTDFVRRGRSRMYKTKNWQKMRKVCLNRKPLCVTCEKSGIVRAAREVDHIIPHRGDEKLFSDLDNLQGLCKSCHSKKTREEQKTVVY